MAIIASKHSWGNYRATGENSKSKGYKQVKSELALGKIVIKSEELLNEIFPKKAEKGGCKLSDRLN